MWKCIETIKNEDGFVIFTKDKLYQEGDERN